MKYLSIFFFTFFNVISYAQNKWYSNSEIGLIANNKLIYFYNTSDNSIKEEIIEPSGFLLKSYSLQYDINYLLLKKLSLGVVSGVEFQQDPNFNMLKLGAVLRYFFVDENNVFFFIQDSNNFTLNSDKFKSGNNFRIGMGMPILKKDNFIINSSLFFQQNYFKLNKDNKLIGYPDEKARELTTKAYGLTFGVKF